MIKWAKEAIHDPLIDQLVNDPDYRICKNGKIWGKIPLSGPKSSSKTYPWRVVGTQRGGYRLVRYRGKIIRIHRVIYRKFVGKLGRFKEVNHKNGNKSDNRVQNLELMTSKQNIDHAIKYLHHKGTAILSSKLNPTKVIEIRNFLKDGYSHRKLGSIYHVHHSIISDIKNKKIWKHVK